MRKSKKPSKTQPGTLDPDFGIGGVQALEKILEDHGDLNVRFRFGGLATAKDGKLLFSASVYRNHDDQYLYGLGRLSTDGSLDKSFGTNGLVTGDFLPSLPAGGSRLTVQSAGNILMLGWTWRSASNGWANLVIARFNSEGEPDTNFAEQGRRILPTKDYEELIGESATVHVQSDGRILVSANYVAHDNPDQTVGVLFRLQPDGALDESFNKTGRLEFKLAGSNVATAVNACISQGSDHKIVFVGHARFIPTLKTALFARLNPDGSPDAGFGSPKTPGFHPMDSIKDHTTFNALTERADNSLVGAGQIGQGGAESTKGLMQAITPNGAVHQLFNNGKPLVSQFDSNHDNGWQCIMQTSTGNLVTASTGNWIYIAQFKTHGVLDLAFNNQGYNDMQSEPRSPPVLLTERGDQRIIAGANVSGIDDKGVGQLRCLFGQGHAIDNHRAGNPRRQ
ncbi:hypothetical protein [Pseudomonas marginalis]|uniref:hypothetical protein n=1 Tax=Pseudomonas marginalis TaxID=298 RepID=UPI003BA00FD1